MSLSKISEKMFGQAQFILTSLPAVNAAVTDQLGFTRKQVIATVSHELQAEEFRLAATLARGLARREARPVMILTHEDPETCHARLAAHDDDVADRLIVENPRSWTDFEQTAGERMAAVQPIMLFIDSPSLTIPCSEGWNYVLHQTRVHDPWGGMARRVKALAADCPVWVFGELCYGARYRQPQDPSPLPPGETGWRTCAQLEAYIDYWDCVIELSHGAHGLLQMASLKNRLSGGFSEIELYEAQRP